MFVWVTLKFHKIIVENSVAITKAYVNCKTWTIANGYISQDIFIRNIQLLGGGWLPFEFWTGLEVLS